MKKIYLPFRLLGGLCILPLSAITAVIAAVVAVLFVLIAGGIIAWTVALNASKCECGGIELIPIGKYRDILTFSGHECCLPRTP